MPIKKITQEDIDVFIKKLEELENIKLTQENIDDLNQLIRNCMIEIGVPQVDHKKSNKELDNLLKFPESVTP